MDPIRVYNLGEQGVNVDLSPIHTLDGQLSSAQNCIRQPLGLIAGIQKRPGLVKFGTSAAAGVVLGGIGVPLVLLTTSIGGVSLPGGGDGTVSIAGPAAGEGGGDSTGLGTGAGSGSGGGGAVASGGGSGTGGGGSGSLSTHGRTVFIAKTQTGLGVGAPAGWWSTLNPTSAGVVSAATDIVTATTPLDAMSSLSSATLAMDDTPWSQLQGNPAKACVVNNVLFYPSNNYTPADGLTFLPVMNFNGTTQAVAFYLTPKVLESDGANNVFQVKVMSLLANGTDIYVSVATARTGVAARGGQVYKLDTLTATYQLVGDSFLTGNGYIPYSLCWHLGRLWCGTIGRLSVAGRLYSIRPGVETTWTLERTMTQGFGVGSLCSYNGELYAGSFDQSPQVVEKRDTLGTWTVDKSITGPGAAAGSFLQMRTFQASPGVTNLYAAVGYPTAAASTYTLRIYERTAAGTWTLRYDVAKNAGAAGSPVGMLVEAVVNQCLWVFGGDYNFNTNGAFLLTSADGVTWSDQSTKLTTPAGRAAMAAYGEMVL